MIVVAFKRAVSGRNREWVMEGKIKGELLLPLVGVILRAKDLPWKDFLIDDDMKLLDSPVDPSGWYPAASYMRMADAVWKLIAKEMVEPVRALGRSMIVAQLKGQYKLEFMGLGHGPAIERLVAKRREQVDFLTMEVVERAEKSCSVKVSGFGEFKGIELFLITLLAGLEVLVEFNQGAVSKADLKDVDHEGEPAYILEVQWE